MDAKARQQHAQHQRQQALLQRDVQRVRRLFDQAYLAQAQGLPHHELRRLAMGAYRGLPQHAQDELSCLARARTTVACYGSSMEGRRP